MLNEQFADIFRNCKNVNEIKSAYRRLALKFHPDKSQDDGKMFRELNETYLTYLENWDGVEFEDHTYYYNPDAEKIIIDLFSKYCNINNLFCEIIGTWLWISGSTKEIKSLLKNDGFKWSHNKMSWYFHTGNFRKKSHLKLSLEEIRDLFGTYKPTTQGIQKIAN